MAIMTRKRREETGVNRTRRRLVAGLVAAPLAGLCLGEVLARDEGPGKEAAQGGEEEPGPHRAEAEALLGLVALRFGEHLDAETSEEVRSEIERSLSGAAEMSAAGLRNAEEPAVAFAPLRREGGER